MRFLIMHYNLCKAIDLKIPNIDRVKLPPKKEIKKSNKRRKIKMRGETISDSRK